MSGLSPTPMINCLQRFLQSSASSPFCSLSTTKRFLSSAKPRSAGPLQNSKRSTPCFLSLDKNQAWVSQPFQGLRPYSILTLNDDRWILMTQKLLTSVRWRARASGRSPSTTNDRDVESDDDSDDDDDDDDDDEPVDVSLSDGESSLGQKSQKFSHFNSPRLNAVLRHALTLKKNEFETAFYEGRVRRNGVVVTKKSLHVKRGDRIEVENADRDAESRRVLRRVVVTGLFPGQEKVKIVVTAWPKGIAVRE